MRRRGCEGRIGSFTQSIEHYAELREFAQDDSLDGTSIELPDPLTRGCLSLLPLC